MSDVRKLRTAETLRTSHVSAYQRGMNAGIAIGMALCASAWMLATFLGGL